MPNVMVALPNMPSVQRRKVWPMPTTWLLCSNAAKTRMPLKLAGVPQTTGPDRSQPLLGRSSPYYGDIWRTYCWLTSYFSVVDTCLISEDIARQNCAMVPKWRFFASCISREPRAARFRPASEIRTKATPCMEVWQTSNLRRLRLGEKKKKERRNHRAKI